MLHNLKGRFLRVEEFRGIRELFRIIERLLKSFPEKAIRLQVFPIDSPKIIVIYAIPGVAPNIRIFLFDTVAESLVSNIDLDELKGLLDRRGQVEIYVLTVEEMRIDMEIINYRALLDSSTSYVLALEMKEIASSLDTVYDQHYVESAENIGQVRKAEEDKLGMDTHFEGSLYEVLIKLVNNEASTKISDPLFLAKILMGSNPPIVNKVPKHEVREFLKQMLQTQRNKVLTCMMHDGILYHLYMNGRGKVGLCATDPSGTKVCGKDAVEILRKIEKKCDKEEPFVTIMIYDVPAGGGGGML